MKRHPIHFLNLVLLILLVTLLPPETSTHAQRQVGRAGHALDANLKLGSGGYNRVGTRATGSRATGTRGLERTRYSAGRSRDLYTINRAGSMSYNPHNAFAPRSRYRSTGYRGDTFSNDYHRRFRYDRSFRRR